MDNFPTKGSSDFKEKVILVSEAEGNALNYFNFVVNSFQEAGMYWIAAMGKYSIETILQSFCKLFKRFYPGSNRSFVPAVEPF